MGHFIDLITRYTVVTPNPMGPHDSHSIHCKPSIRQALGTMYLTYVAFVRADCDMWDLLDFIVITNSKKKKSQS